MIYHFSILNDDNVTKDFYLTADSPNQLYRRALMTYGVTRDKVTLIAEYKETGTIDCKFNRSFKEVEKIDSAQLEKARKIFSKQRGLKDPFKANYKEKYDFSECDISSIDDLIPLLEKYKKVKVYWEPTDKRGVHRLYALYK